MRKTYNANQSFWLVCCCAKFIQFKSVLFVREISCRSITTNLLFASTAKLLLESRLLSLRVTQSTLTTESSHMTRCRYVMYLPTSEQLQFVKVAFQVTSILC